MRLVSFEHENKASWGRVEGNAVINLGAVPGVPATLIAALEQGGLNAFATTEGPRLDRAEIRLLPAVAAPRKVLCVGHNYEEHRQETGRAKTAYPSIFTRFSDTLIGANDPIIRPKVSENLDYEAELAVIIGKGGRNIPESEALGHVAGYTCFNDASVRDWQWHTAQFIPGKNFPGTGPLGPELVTPDEIEDLGAVRVQSILNGTVMQDSTVDHMIFPIARVIAYVSTFTPLAPGDVIATGTPGGVGAKCQPPVWMKPGDEIEVRISGVGTLKSRIVAED